MIRNNSYINHLIARMSLEQKIGAMLTLGFSGVVPKANIYKYIEEYHCGGLRLETSLRQFGNYVDPKSNATVVKIENKTGIRFKTNAPACTASQYKAVLDELQEHARNRELGIPLHFSFDQEGGSSANFFFGGVNLFTKPMGICAMDDPKMAYKIAKAVSDQCRAVGFNWIHSPVLDVNSEPSNPEVYTRAYSDDANVVAEYALEACKGFKEGGVIATGKHFPGRGHSDVDAHFKVPVIDVDYQTLMERELLPYRKLIEAGQLPSVMIAHSIFPAVDPEHIATVSKKVVTGLLREELGFEGVITTDSMTMGALATRYGVANACAMALEAGVDLVLMKAENHLVEDTIAAIRNSIESGRITQEELDNKVYRILNLKYEYGLFHGERENIVPEQVLQDQQIVALAKQAAKRSILIERDPNQLIPVKQGKVLVIEQQVTLCNDFRWHSGLLYEQCLKHHDQVDYLETSYAYDAFDEEQIRGSVADYDTIIATNFFQRGKGGNKEFWEQLFEEFPDKNIIIVTNTPYEQVSIPANAKSVLLTFATTPENIKATAAILFGNMKPEGVWPLKYTQPGGGNRK
jgi:beta-N-acetylhexosaminidase